MKKFLLLISITGLLPLFSQAQMQGPNILPAVVVGKDTIGIITLPDIIVVSKRIFISPDDQFRFNQLKKNVLIVYPYAKAAGEIFSEVNQSLAETDRRHDQKKFLKEKEKELDAQFENQLKNLTTTQGEILVKLIARQTGQNCYELIKELKNPLSAFFWQNAGKLWGYNLKVAYDPQEDKDIELIVRSIEDDL